jgi:hypothetical protein
MKQLMKENSEIKTPKQCEGCNPWNPEDSCAYEERPNYTPKENRPEHELLGEAQLAGMVIEKIMRKSRRTYCNTCIVGRESPDMCGKCDRRPASQGGI